ncbi:hypothetical protein PS9374_01968 [Planomonospora sphaerica]|uniref:Knr4/Smi1-like domain-containing protein n=1 Tax=Planomonospora sphaerica TaxID=161355 RepID=A0A171C979_9ACTN|nr:SMI1/KNR4 family protein [Planomonospora sphaerica]GAT66319.1 hypothetical protein PS9374_01968 [Planomonospora sphaerica]
MHEQAVTAADVFAKAIGETLWNTPSSEDSCPTSRSPLGVSDITNLCLPPRLGETVRSNISLDELATELVRLNDHATITPLPAATVNVLEETIGAPLPEEFRSFLLRLGPGVAPGPLLSLDWITEETRYEQECFLEEPGIAAHPWEPFPVSQADVLRLRQLAAEGRNPLLTLGKPLPGTMFLRSHGCSWISMLAMNGEFAGTVWLTEMGWVEDMRWWPSAPWLDANGPGPLYSGWTEPVPFLDWYILWTRRNAMRPQGWRR